MYDYIYIVYTIFSKFATKCSKCADCFQDGNWTRKMSDTAVYHMNCFACYSCNFQLSHQLSALHEDRLLCETHYMESCQGRSTSGKILFTMGRKFVIIIINNNNNNNNSNLYTYSNYTDIITIVHNNKV